MNFEPTEEQQLIAETARQFAAQVLSPRAAGRDQGSVFPEEELRRLGADMSFLSVVGSDYEGALLRVRVEKDGRAFDRFTRIAFSQILV